jgi:hypothetical protein
VRIGFFIYYLTYYFLIYYFLTNYFFRFTPELLSDELVFLGGALFVGIVGKLGLGFWIVVGTLEFSSFLIFFAELIFCKCYFVNY